MQKWVKVLTVLLAVYTGILYSVTSHTDAHAKAPEVPLKEFTAEEAAEMLKDRTKGSDDAPIKMLNISAMSCTHCADMHETIMPEIIKKYVDTGIVKVQYVDLPSDAFALAGSLTTHCAPEDRYFPLVDALYKKQLHWMKSSRKLQENLIQYAALAGVPPARTKACFASKTLQAELLNKRKFILETYRVKSTPMVILIKGETTSRIEGVVPTLEMIENNIKMMMEED